jgi:CRP-like cAMP-binding protein
MKLVTSSSEGRILLLRFTAPGEVLGLTESVLGQSSYLCTAIAAEATTVANIPRDTFIRFVTSYPEACLRLTTALSEQYKSAQRETKFLAFGGTSTSRLAHLLLEQAAEYGETAADGIHIPSHVTHSELAQSIGATRETVTRILGDLNQRGILERTDGAIIIRSPDELTRIGTY